MSYLNAAPIRDETVDSGDLEGIELLATPISNVKPELEGEDSVISPSTSFIDQCVQEIELIIESALPLTTSQPNTTIAAENAHISCLPKLNSARLYPTIICFFSLNVHIPLSSKTVCRGSRGLPATATLQ